MKNKVGRNDPCPCGSGKKYKKCHGKQTATSLQPLSEEMILADLLRSSNVFGEFYRSQRSKIAKPIVWIHDASLREETPSKTSKLPSGDLVISLRSIPAEVKDAKIIAHELEHILVYQEGFPATTYKDERYTDLSEDLNSMLHDVIVDRKLQAYGFDLWEDYYQEERDTLAALNRSTEAPSSHLRRMNWILNYASHVLDWEWRNEIERRDNMFQEWFDERFPDIAKEGKELLALIRSIGFNTPESMNSLLQEIIRRYRLSGLYVAGAFD